MIKSPQISFIIPAKDEEKTIRSLYSQILAEVKNLKKPMKLFLLMMDQMIKLSR